jgi:hypothetical protein
VPKVPVGIDVGPSNLYRLAKHIRVRSTDHCPRSTYSPQVTSRLLWTDKLWTVCGLWSVVRGLTDQRSVLFSSGIRLNNLIAD